MIPITKEQFLHISQDETHPLYKHVKHVNEKGKDNYFINFDNVVDGKPLYVNQLTTKSK